MQFFNRDDVAAALPPTALIDALDAAFAGEFATPLRAHHDIPVPTAANGTLLLMPAWQQGEALGVKIATVFPDNERRGLASVNASYLLLDAETGVPRAIMDGTELTLRRTAAASALASRYLSRQDASTLLMVGTGKLAPHMIAAHAAVRPLRRVFVWGRRSDAAMAVVSSLELPDIEVTAVDDLAAAVPDADIISCATLSSNALLQGTWLQPGQHLDLVGAFTPQMREADDEALQRSAVFVDTYDGALGEAGDILQAIGNGALAREDLRAELAELARGERDGRRSAEEITLFKSVGSALEDLVAARLVADSASG